MHCSTCGNLLPPGARVCPNCGTPVPNAVPSSPSSIPPSEQTNFGNFDSFAEAGPTIPDSPASVDKTVRQVPPTPLQDPYASGYSTPTPQEQFQFPEQPYQPYQPYQSYQQPAQSSPQQPPYASNMPQQQAYPGGAPQQYSDTTQQDIPVSHQPAYPGILPQQPPYPAPAGQFGQQGQPPQSWQPVQPVQPVQPAPRRRSTGLIIALIAAIVLVIAGSVLVYYLGVARPAQLHAQATATVVTSLTGEAQGTAVANTHATGTAQAQANATTTAVAEATAQVQATMTAYVSLYTQATGGTPALNDPLTQNDANNWYVHSSSTGACAFTGGALHVTGVGAFCTAQATNFGNFAYQAKISVLKGTSGAGGGLMFRLNTTLLKYYIFGIGADGSYSLVLIQVASGNKSTFKNLATGFSQAITQGLNQTNTIAILVRGSNFYLYANNQYITQFSDSSSASGAIGVFGVDNSSGLDVAFTNAEVWRA